MSAMRFLSALLASYAHDLGKITQHLGSVVVTPLTTDDLRGTTVPEEVLLLRTFGVAVVRGAVE